MRISTTPLIIICTVFFLGMASHAFAQVPKFEVVNLQHTCGPGTPATGSFVVRILDADPSMSALTITVQSGATTLPPIVISPVPASFPVTRTITGLTGATGGGARSYLVIVADDDNSSVADNGPNFSIFNFEAKLGTATNNTNADCTAPNGAITVTLAGNTGVAARPIVYSWTGPGGFTSTSKDISGLRGGSYTLTYQDSNSPATQCTLGPIVLTDPSPANFTISAPSSICEGDDFDVTISQTDAGYTYSVLEGASVLASATPGNASNATINISSLPAGTHTLRVSASQGSCLPKFNQPSDISITVNPAPDYNNLPNGVVCSGDALGLNINTTLKKVTSVTATSFKLVSLTYGALTPGPGLPTANGSTIAANDLSDDVWFNFTNADIDVTYTIETYAGTCPGNTITVKYTVNPQPDYNNGDFTSPGVCSGQTIGVTLDGLVKATSVTATSYSVIAVTSTGLTAGTGGAGTAVPYSIASGDLANDTWINTQNTITNVTYRIVPYIGTCDGAAFDVVVAITPEPLAPANTPVSICSDVALNVNLQGIVNLGNSVTSTFSWAATDNTNVTGESTTTQTASSITDVLNNVTSTTQQVIYDVTPTGPGSCAGTPFKVTVTVNPEPFSPDLNKTICSDDNVAVNLQTQGVDLGNAIAGTTFSWYADDNTSVSGESTTPQTGQTINDALNNVTATNQTVTYHIIPTSASGCVGEEFTLIVTVQPEPTAPINLAKTICSEDNVSFNLQTDAIDLGNAIASTTFTWIAADNANVTGESLSSQTSVTIGDVLVNTVATAQQVTYTVTPKSPLGCNGNPFDVVVTVSPKPDYNDFTNVPSGGICADPVGVDVTTLIKTNSVAATTFTVDSINPDGMTQVGGTATPNDISDDVWSNVDVTFHDVVYTITPSVGACDGDPFTVTIRVKPQPDYVSTPVTVCSSVATGFDLDTAMAPTSVTANSFDITAIAIPANVTATAGSPAVANNVTKTAIMDDVWKNTTAGPLDVVYTITPRTGTCTGAPFDITVTVNPEPVYSTITLPDICSGDAVGFDLELQKLATGISATSFTVTDELGTVQTGNNMVIADDIWTITTAVLTKVYKIIPKTADGCDGQEFSVTVKVNPEPAYANFTNTTGVCSDPLGIVIGNLKQPTSVAADAFTVTLPTNLTQLAGAGTPADLTDDVWENETGAFVDITYHIIPKLGTCEGDEFTVTVRILPTPVYTDYTGSICGQAAVGVDITTLNDPSFPDTDTFTITVINPNGLTQTAGAATPGDISDDAWKNDGIAAGTIQYSIVPKTGTCSGSPFTVTMTINPEPRSPAIPKTICSTNNVAVDLQVDGIDTGNQIAGTTFEWIATDNTNVTGESLTLQTTSVINDALVNLTTVDQTVVYDVTPTSPLGCEGAVFKVTVTIASKPVVAAGQTATICGGNAVGYAIQTTPAGQPVGTTFTWVATDNPNVTGESTTSQTGGTITDVLVNTLNTPQIVTYSVTPSLGSCVGLPVDIQITVNRGYTAIAGSDQTICTDNGPYTLVGSSAKVGSTQITGRWLVVGTPVDHDETVTSGYLADPSTAVFSATKPGDYILRLETEPDPSGICQPGIDDVVITVTPKPVIAPNQSTLVCGNEPTGYAIQMTKVDIHMMTVFTWPTPNDPSGQANAVASPPGGIPLGAPVHLNDVLTNETNANIVVTYTVTPSVGLCIGAPVDITVTVKPSPVVAFGQTKTICSGDAVDYEILLNPLNTPANTKFSWPDPDGAGSDKLHTATSRQNIDLPAGTPHITDTLYHFDAAGVPKTVTYQVISQGINGCYGRTRDVNIVVNSGAIAEAGPAQTTCANGTLTLSNASVIGAASGTWTIVSGPAGGVITPGPTVADASFRATLAGQYVLRLTSDVPSAGSCSPVSDDVVVTVKAPNDPSCTGGGSECDNVSVQPMRTAATCSNADGSVHFDIRDTLTGNPAVPPSGDIKITITGSSTVVNFNDPDFSGLAVGLYDYVVEFGTICTKTGNFSIGLSGTVGEPVATIVTDPVCFGGTGTAIISAIDENGNDVATGVALEWSTGTTWTSFIGGGTVTGLPAGTNTIFVRRNGDACSGAVVISFPDVSEITATVTATNATCSNDNGMIALENLTGGTGAYTFALNGNQVAAPADNIFTELTSDTYTITVRDAAGCARIFGPIEITYPGPTSFVDTLYVKKAISFPDLPSGSALIGVQPSGYDPYETRLELTEPLFPGQVFASDWSSVALNPQNLKFEKSYTNLYAGGYTLGIRDAIGCERYYDFTIDVDVNLFIPNIFTPNEDGHNDVFYIRNLPGDAKLLIANRWGNEVYKSSAYQNDWGGGDAPDGLYYYTLNVAGQSFTGWVEILRAR